jgi:hypothetical protein
MEHVLRVGLAPIPQLRETVAKEWNHGEDGARLNHDVEEIIAVILFGRRHELLENQQVCGGRNRQKLRNPLHDSEQRHNKPVRHALFTLETAQGNKRQIRPTRKQVCQKEAGHARDARRNGGSSYFAARRSIQTSTFLSRP